MIMYLIKTEYINLVLLATGKHNYDPSKSFSPPLAGHMCIYIYTSWTVCYETNIMFKYKPRKLV